MASKLGRIPGRRGQPATARHAGRARVVLRAGCIDSGSGRELISVAGRRMLEATRDETLAARYRPVVEVSMTGGIPEPYDPCRAASKRLGIWCAPRLKSTTNGRPRCRAVSTLSPCD